MSLIYEDVYDLKNFFIKGKDFMKGRTVVNQFPYQEIFDSYCDKLEKEEFDGEMYLVNDEYYEREFNLPDSSFYKVHWSVGALKQCIKKFNLPKVQIDIKGAYTTVDISNINAERLIAARKNREPIIIGVVPFLDPMMFILDGNHRVVANYQNGTNIIDGYILTPGHFINAINSRYIQMVLMMHYNIWLIDRYMIGECNKEEFEENLFPV